MNYQPASWDGSDSQAYVDSQGYADSQGYVSGQGYTDGQGYQDPGYIQSPTVQSPGYVQSPGSVQTTMRDQQGRQYRCVCVPITRPSPRPGTNLNQIARLILGRNINDALRIYRNIRVVIRDGQHLIVTQDFRRDRINVETRNNIIIRIVGFY